MDFDDIKTKSDIIEAIHSTLEALDNTNERIEFHRKAGSSAFYAGQFEKIRLELEAELNVLMDKLGYRVEHRRSPAVA